MIKIFIGTCSKNEKAEKALEYSIKINTLSKVDIVFMRPDSNDVLSNWNMDNWGTSFTPFRWIVPHLCNFKGKAIYLDVDTLLLSDIKNLWKKSIPKDKVLLSIKGNYSVMLIDCKKFKQKMSISSIDEWKKKSCTPKFNGLYNDYVCQLESKNLVEPLESEWNSLDTMDNNTKLIHYTEKTTQPWKPYKDKHVYKRHPHILAEKTWFRYYSQSIL